MNDFQGLMGMPPMNAQPPVPQSPMGGLLGGPGMDPQKMGLLAAAFAGLKASGNSRMPVSLGQTMGEAGQAGMDAMRQGTQDQMRQQQFGMQQQQFGMQNQMHQMQLAKHAQDLKKAQEQEAHMSAFAASLPADKQAAFRANPTAFIQEMNKRHTVAPGGTLVGNDGTALFNSAKEPRTAADATGVMRYVDGPNVGQVVPGFGTQKAPEGFSRGPDGRLVIDQDFLAGKKAIAAAGAPRMTNINMQEKEESKVVGKFYGESYADVQKAGFNASSRIARMDRLNQLLNNVDTGKLTPAGTEIAAYAESLGMKIDKNLGNKQAAQALANEMALELRNPAGGAGMPGAMSDADREFLKSMTPGLSTSPEGRKQITETAKKIAKRDQEVAARARDYRKKNGSIDEGFYDEMRTFSDKNPLFGTAAPTGFRVLGKE